MALQQPRRTPSRSARRSPTSAGSYQGAGPLPSDYERYKFVDVSQEPIDRNPAHSGQSVLRGQLGRLRPAPANTKKGQPAILGQVVLAPPQG